MTANTVFTVAEANDSLRLPNAALRFWPASVPRERERELIAGTRRGKRGAGPEAGREEGQDGGEDAHPAPVPAPSNGVTHETAPASPIASAEGVLRFARSGRTRWHPRVIWIEGDGGAPEPRVVHVGITDGTASQIRDGDLDEGVPVIVGTTNFSAEASRPNNPFGGPFGGRRGGSKSSGRR